jgi:hypothetical protein
MSISQQLLEQSIQLNIQQALQEDIGDGDITALLTPEDEQATATIISREDMILAGQPWVNALIAAFDSSVQITWLKNDGDLVFANETIFKLAGSAHLLILRSGEVLQFVNFNDRAWHAGRSSYLAKKECNDYSIGIELEGSDDLPFEDAQYETLVHVTACLQQAYPQIQQHLAGHSDIAPGRKTDPGTFFDWLDYRNRLQQLKSQ